MSENITSLDFDDMRKRAIAKRDSIIITENMRSVFDLVESEEYRSDVRDMPYYAELSEIVFSSRADIREKLSILKPLSEECESDFRRVYKEALKDLAMLEKAVKLMENDNEQVYFEVRRKQRTGCGDIDERKLPNSFRTFDAAINAIKEDSSEVESEDDGTWYFISRMNSSGKCKDPQISYLVGCKGTVWKFRFSDDTAKKNGFSRTRPNEHWNITFGLDGDIVTIDCRPFQNSFHALIVYDEETNAVYVENGRVKCLDLECCRGGFEDFSPALRIETYSDELPEEEKILDEFSRLISKENGLEISEAIFDYVYRNQNMIDDSGEPYCSIGNIRKKFLSGQKGKQK